MNDRNIKRYDMEPEGMTERPAGHFVDASAYFGLLNKHEEYREAMDGFFQSLHEAVAMDTGSPIRAFIRAMVAAHKP